MNDKIAQKEGDTDELIINEFKKEQTKMNQVVQKTTSPTLASGETKFCRIKTEPN